MNTQVGCELARARVKKVMPRAWALYSYIVRLPHVASRCDASICISFANEWRRVLSMRQMRLFGGHSSDWNTTAGARTQSRRRKPQRWNLALRCEEAFNQAGRLAGRRVPAPASPTGADSIGTILNNRPRASAKKGADRRVQSRPSLEYREMI
jgi:hypothetical protein